MVMVHDSLAHFGTCYPASAEIQYRSAHEMLAGRAILDARTIHVHDLRRSQSGISATAEGLRGIRTYLGTPLLREGTAIGALEFARTEVQPFSEKQIDLLETFADQAVIAIENVRLFQELEARTRELARSVGELKALGEVGQAVSSTLDLETVLNDASFPMRSS